MTDISDGFSQFVAQYQVQADENVKHLTALSGKLADLARQYNDVRRDLERERVAGRHAQELVESLEGKLKALDESTTRAAFVLVLIDADADAYLFDDKYYAGDPADGGKRAAVDLKAAVQQQVKALDPLLGDVPVMARAFASGEGLATLLAKAGIARPGESHDVLSRFTCGFSQAEDLFDFVMVGKGKDRADHKLMAAFRQFVESPSCRHVLLACCHDNGYVRMLEKCVHKPALVDKVTMVKSFQTGSEFAPLPFRTTSMDVFRAGPLLAAGAPASGQKRAGAVANGAAAPTNGHPEPATSSASGGSKFTGTSSSPSTYASRAAAPQPVANGPSRALPMFGTLDKNTILVNADGHRIDMPLPPRSAPAAEAFNRKTSAGKRFCNIYHLYGSCSSNCGYLHERLTPEEELVMRHRLRGEKCLDGGKCRGPRCFYGHHCDCSRIGKKCRFPADMHGVDVTSWKEEKVCLAV